MKASELKAALLKLARQNVHFEIQELRKVIAEKQSGMYSQVFELAKRCGNRQQWEAVTEAIKSEAKAKGDLIDRTYSSAVAETKRLWKAVEDAVQVRGGKHHVHVKTRGPSKALKRIDLDLKLSSVESFTQLRQVGEQLRGNGGGLSTSLASKKALLDEHLRKADEKTAAAALDAALAYFLVGTTPRKKAEGPTAKAKAKKPARTSKTPAGVRMGKKTTGEARAAA